MATLTRAQLERKRALWWRQYLVLKDNADKLLDRIRELDDEIAAASAKAPSGS